MKVSSAWIKECLCRTMLYANIAGQKLGRTIISDAELVEALERAGIEIEQIISSKAIDEKVIVGLVKNVVQHPGADRLKLAEVVTKEGSYGVVCGAPNVRAGLKVAFAQIGTTLPDGDRIEKAKLRGEVSEGMLCSERELGIGDDHNGIIELPESAEVGATVRGLYPADSQIDLKTPANRWDVQSMSGLAREVAAMTGNTYEPLTPPPVKLAPAKPELLGEVEASRYALARISVAPDSPSPAEVAARLRFVGVRSISAIVDVTNYVMLETGQPLHAFDAAKVRLPIEVRRAKAGETLETLDGVNRKLQTADLVIADQSGPIALAGLMGGKTTEVSSSTTEILLEAAVFDGAVVRKTAQRHGLRTEASARFERSLPGALPPLGLARALEMLQAVAAGELKEAFEATHVGTKPRNIALPLSRLNSMLGFVISHNEAISALGRLGIVASAGADKKGQEALIAVSEVPWWRPDLAEPADLIEEIVRVIGYDRVPSTIPWWRPTRIHFDRSRSLKRRVRDVLYGAGAFEVMTYSFVSAEQLSKLGLGLGNHLKLKNPLSSEQAYLRSSLLPSHLATLERNRKYAKSLAFYEISNVFLKRGAGEQPDEPLRLAVSVNEPRGAYAAAKGLLDELAATLNVELLVKPAHADTFVPGRFGEIIMGKAKIGQIGQVHARFTRELKIDGEVAHFELDLATVLAASSTRPYVAPSPYPTITRDLTLVVPIAVTWSEVQAAASGWNVEFAGDYYGQELPAETKGMTIRLTLSLPDRTPTEADAEALEQAVLTRLSHKVHAKRRA